MADVVWRPTPDRVERSHLYRFMRRHGIGEYDELFRRSVEDVAWFWEAVAQDLGFEWSRPYQRVMDTSAGIPWTRWFTGGTINLSHNALDRHVRDGRGEQTAIVWEGEEGAVRRLTYREVLALTNRLADALRALGINQGDRVGIYLPMVPEAAVAILATARVGAVFTPIFSGYGAQALATRLADAGAKLLFTADGFYRRGQRVEMKRTADEAAALCPELRHVVVVRRGGWEVPWTEGRDVAWDDLLAGRSETGAPAPTGSEDPFLLIYTSGTTGRPKGTVHVHGGFPLKCVQDIAHCFDLHAGETLFWVTDMGWVMGPWEVIGALTLGATCLLYDGTPDFPAPDRLWSLVERHRVNVLGLSPTAIRSLMTQGEDWVRRHDLSSLHTIGGTGEPWNPEPWYWYFRHVGGGRCPMINYSGGTEIGGGIVGCVPLKPIKPCGFTGPIPGMDAEVVDEDGRPVRGSVGELVIRQPWPGMTRGFWQDRDRYLSTYWSRWPDVWVHGDWALVDEDGFWFIQGRSDDTLKVAGKRLGPAEVESALVSHPAVAEAAAIGVPHEVKGEVVVAFAVLRPGFEPGETLREELKEAVAQHLGKALRPHDVRFVTDLPKTRNAKILRRLIRAAYLGETQMGDTSSLENPQALEAIRQSL